jgi:hypothetical protein
MTRTALLAAIASLVGSCSTRFDCQPRSVTPSGDLRTDVLGAWDGFGIDSRVVAVFRADGGFAHVEEPNSYAPNGGTSTSPYRVLDGGVLDVGGITAAASVSGSALVLDGRAHPALSCRGEPFGP